MTNQSASADSSSNDSTTAEICRTSSHDRSQRIYLQRRCNDNAEYCHYYGHSTAHPLADTMRHTT